jgi:hypothetical protein
MTWSALNFLEYFKYIIMVVKTIAVSKTTYKRHMLHIVCLQIIEEMH